MLARILKVTNTGESGASAVEYGLLVAGIAVAIIAIVFTLGGTVNTLFADANGRFGNSGNPAPAPPAN